VLSATLKGRRHKNADVKSGSTALSIVNAPVGSFALSLVDDVWFEVKKSHVPVAAGCESSFFCAY